MGAANRRHTWDERKPAASNRMTTKRIQASKPHGMANTRYDRHQKHVRINAQEALRVGALAQSTTYTGTGSTQQRAAL